MKDKSNLAIAIAIIALTISIYNTFSKSGKSE